MKSRVQRSVRAAILGLGMNVCLAAGKLAAGLIGHSQALVADAVESFADVISSLVVWRGIVVAAEPADEDHPYGHGKAEPLSAALVAIMLMGAAMGIVVHACEGLAGPRQGPAAFTLIVLLGVVALKEGLFRFVQFEADALDSSAVRSDAWHHRSDAITSLAAAIGISIALLGGEEYAMADSLAAMAGACVIGWNGWRLLRPAMDELMDTRAPMQLTSAIRDLAAATWGVEQVEKCIVRKMGYHYFVDMHVEVDSEMTVREAHQIAHEVKDKIRAQLPRVKDVLVHVEPRRRAPLV